MAKFIYTIFYNSVRASQKTLHLHYEDPLVNVQGNNQCVFQIKSSPVHHSSVILLFDATNLDTGSVVK
jgi:hypothetical protein